MKRELPTEVAGIPVEKVVQLDGVKLYLQNGSWLLARPSENESVMRFYAEGHSLEEVEQILRMAPTIGLM
jgi:phosphomannomutase